jgi:carbamoyltransferase
MKDILNSKVKFREWFRPFAPVCKIEDKDVFFENAPDCKYMSFAPKVKETWRTKLPSITHADNTSRLQTVSNDCFFYEILTEMSNQSLIPVLLNTSFNIKGLPILTTLKDAFHVLNNTDLDILIHKNRIYKKK